MSYDYERRVADTALSPSPENIEAATTAIGKVLADWKSQLSVDTLSKLKSLKGKLERRKVTYSDLLTVLDLLDKDEQELKSGLTAGRERNLRVLRNLRRQLTPLSHWGWG